MAEVACFGVSWCRFVVVAIVRLDTLIKILWSRDHVAGNKSKSKSWAWQVDFCGQQITEKHSISQHNFNVLLNSKVVFRRTLPARSCRAREGEKREEKIQLSGSGYFIIFDRTVSVKYSAISLFLCSNPLLRLTPVADLSSKLRAGSIVSEKCDRLPAKFGCTNFITWTNLPSWDRTKGRITCDNNIRGDWSDKWELFVREAKRVGVRIRLRTPIDRPRRQFTNNNNFCCNPPAAPLAGFVEGYEGFLCSRDVKPSVTRSSIASWLVDEAKNFHCSSQRRQRN